MGLLSPEFLVSRKPGVIQKNVQKKGPHSRLRAEVIQVCTDKVVAGSPDTGAEPGAGRVAIQQAVARKKPTVLHIQRKSFAGNLKTKRCKR